MHQQKTVIDVYNEIAEKYRESLYHELDGKPLDRILLNRFASNMLDASAILDLGCGCGHTTRYLYDRGLNQIEGVDLSPGMVQEAKGMNTDVELKFSVGNMLDLDYANDSIDGIIAFYAIVHFSYKEIEDFLRQVHRVLKAQGTILFSFHIGEDYVQNGEFFDYKTDIKFYLFEVDRILEIAKYVDLTPTETIIRYPYEGKEYPSRRAYITLQAR